jgi:hypothetical protein
MSGPQRPADSDQTCRSHPFMFLVVSVKTSLATKIKRHFQN